MLLTFPCETCKARLRINCNAMGSDLNCPECDALIRVPTLSLGPGFVVGGFLIKHKVGQGGMGEVYVARQLSLERDVALKILPERFTRDHSFVVRFLKEVHYQARLDHPNIVTAYDAGEDNGVYYMAMSYVSGETLEERLDRDGCIPEQDAIQIIRQVAMALQYASEQKGILHRDIKPGNIMVTPTLHAKVLDLGLSKNTLEKKAHTHADTLLGTPNYMSPEQIDHPNDLDLRSDMFGVGMTLYHMLTGRVPYEDSSYLKTLKRHASEKLDDPREWIPDISIGTVHLLAKMLARSRDDRYASWTEFLQVLKEYQADPVANLPELPLGDTTLKLKEDVPAAHPPSAEEQEETLIRRKPPESAPMLERPSEAGPAAAAAPVQRKPSGVLVSVILGLFLGILGIGLMVRMNPRDNPVVSATPTPRPTVMVVEATPTPAIPAQDLAELNTEFTRIVLAYVRDPLLFDQTLQDLLNLGERATGTVVAEKATEQILIVRRDRDLAVDNELTRLSEGVLEQLRSNGAEAALAWLEASELRFPAESEALLRSLRRRIERWASREERQREQEREEARLAMDELLTDLAAGLLDRKWSESLILIDKAAEQPALFPIAEEVATLRGELTALMGVPDAILDSYLKQLNQMVVLRTKNGDMEVRIRELRPDGLLVQKILETEDGRELGTLDSEVLFRDLSAQELMDRMERMEGSEIELYRALVAERSGNPEACRYYLKQSGSRLADAVWEYLMYSE